MGSMVERKRERLLNVRLSDDEVAMLAALAERDGQSVSDWIRVTIRQSHREAFGERAKPKRKKK